MRLKRGWPLLLLLATLVGLPILEVWILTLVADQIGIWPTLATLVVHAVGGALLMRHEGRRAWQALTNAYTTGKVPTGHLADAALILLGGALLIMPGYLTDVLGFLFLFGWTRPFARKVIAFFLARRNPGTAGPQRWSDPGDSYAKPLPPPGNGPPSRAGEPTIIPGEVEPSPENGRSG